MYKLKSLLVLLVIVTVFFVMSLSNALTDPPSAITSSPISQPLIREGTLAVKLAADLQLGTTENEAEAEDLLNAAGIAPRNGWIADYPVTPDIVGELQAAIGEAADSGKLSIGGNAALQAFQDDISSYSLPLTSDTSGNISMIAPSYPNTSVEEDYYNNEGPPTVTYYAPPTDYAYLYTWVPYPFWWEDFWFPGFFILTDFNVRVRWHHHGHEHEGFVTDHFRNPKTGVISRIDPANRVHGGTFQVGGYKGWTSPNAPGGARDFRGYGITRQPEGAHSSVFDHSVNRQVEHPASDRGFQSRSSAGQLPAAGRGGGSAGTARSGGGSGGGFHGGGSRR